MSSKTPTPARTDPLLAALIAKLPTAGTSWPAEQRSAWLQMVWMAFDVVYGPASGDGAMDVPAFLTRRVDAGQGAAPAAQASPSAPAKPTQPVPRLVIDEQGHARRSIDNAPILPSQVDDILFDKRGELGDLGAIIWADGSRGIPPGAQFGISSSP